MGVQGKVRIWLLHQQDWIQEAADRLLKTGSKSPFVYGSNRQIVLKKSVFPKHSNIDG